MKNTTLHLKGKGMARVRLRGQVRVRVWVQVRVWVWVRVWVSDLNLCLERHMLIRVM